MVSSGRELSMKSLLVSSSSGSVSHLVVSLCDPMDCSTPGSSVHGILQARILEWDAISFSTLSKAGGL